MATDNRESSGRRIHSLAEFDQRYFPVLIGRSPEVRRDGSKVGARLVRREVKHSSAVELSTESIHTLGVPKV